MLRSPCINVCRMDPVRGLCEGCLRTLDEIARWAQTDDADRAVILENVERRRAAPDAWDGALRCDCEE